MQKNNQPASQEKFKTLIGGQALIEGILMQGPDKRAIVVRRADQKEDGLSHAAVYPRRGELRLVDGQRREGAHVLGGLFPRGSGRAFEV